MAAGEPGENEEEPPILEGAPPTHLPSLSTDDAIMPLPHNIGDDFRLFQDLFKKVASSLYISLVEVQVTQHKLVDILHTSASSKITLPMNDDALMDPVRTIWQTPATAPPTCKRSDKKYYVPAKGTDFLFSHPAPNSLVVDAVQERGRQQPKTTPHNKEWKRLDLFDRKAYSLATLLLRIANYQALLAKYDYINYTKISELTDFISEDKREQFTALVSEGQLISKTALQAALDSADTAARSVAMAVMMRRASWLHLSSFPKEVQSTDEDLPFEGPKLFAKKTDDSLHLLKDSRVTLRSLGISTPKPKKK
ncbi:hypothetical protein UY3_09865 [Chelonia mydas]|uniref:Lamina-associated polypeptide 2 alpha C-terminal domain-containing protein n=1 Tax=Chelonia mydas TaxID=8469 RepID=M7BY10_CHEMY|nr:hypothetical protein UY3_09865 [Chelonia mydas]